MNMRDWPKEVRVMGHTLPIWADAVTLEERTASLKWYTQVLFIEPIALPDPPPRTILEKLFGDGRRFSAWVVKCNEINHTNREILAETRAALARQLAHICRCPPEAVLISLRRDNPLEDRITVIGKAPAVAWNE